MEGLWIALAVAIPTMITAITGPLVLAHLTSKQRREERDEDWERQDAVAAKVEEANRIAKAQTRTINTIHKLTNSSYSEQMQSTLDEAKSSLALLYYVADMHAAAGSPPREDAQAVIEAKKKRISQLEEQIAQRAKVADAALDADLDDDSEKGK